MTLQFNEWEHKSNRMFNHTRIFKFLPLLLLKTCSLYLHYGAAAASLLIMKIYRNKKIRKTHKTHPDREFYFS